MVKDVVSKRERADSHRAQDVQGDAEPSNRKIVPLPFLRTPARPLGSGEPRTTLRVVVAQLECWKIGRTGARLYLTVDLGASTASGPSKHAELRGVGPQGGVGRFQADTWLGHKPLPSQALATLMDMQCVF